MALALLLFGAIASNSQTIAHWELSNTPAPSTIANGVTASPLLRGNGVSNPEFGQSKAGFFAWTTENSAMAFDFIEVALNAMPGTNLYIDSISFEEKREPGAIRYREVRFAKNLDNEGSLLQRDTLPADTLDRAVVVPSSGLRACDGETVYLRWYGYGADTLLSKWLISNLRVYGGVESVCSPPAGVASSFTVDSYGSGNVNLSWSVSGAHVLITAREEGLPAALPPCSGEMPLPSPVFGNGASLGQGSYVVYAGNGLSTNISGLKPGGNYTFTAFTYDPQEYCFNRQSGVSVTATLPCNGPQPATGIKGFLLGDSAIISWEMPPCASSVLLLGRYGQPITFDPSGLQADSYLAMPEFGSAPESDDFPSAVYALYQGQEGDAMISNLLQEGDYHFRLYTNFDGTWVAGDAITLSPGYSCPSLNGDFVFISEFHYRNVGVPVDQGAELTGPAGTDLSHYQLLAYAPSGIANVGGVLNTSVGEGGIFRLQDTIPGPEGSFGAVWVPMPGISSVSGAIALYNTLTQTVVEAYTYRATSIQSLADGPAAGYSTTYISPSQSPSTPVGHSVQRNGTLGCPDEAWLFPRLSTPGVVNNEMFMPEGGPLPIALLDFSARLQGGQVKVEWQTATELNNDYMAVERSTDGRAFFEIGRVRGAGTTQSPQSYTLTDASPLPGYNYYRLRQVDYDGAAAYHGPVSVKLTAGQAAHLKVYPTVAREGVWVEWLGLSRSAKLVVVNQLGQVVLQKDLDGQSALEYLPIQQLPAGPYWARLMVPGVQVQASRFMKQ